MIKNLYELYNLIEKVSTALPNVNQFVNSFDSLNREDTSYAAVVLQFRDGTQATEGSVRYRFYLGYVDRVNENTDTPSTSNNILTQSIAEENLRLIINKLYPEVDITFGNTFYPFTQRFTALTAGCYVELAITLAVKDCNYESGSVLRDVEIVSDSNGVKEVVPGAGVDGFKKVIVRTEVPLKEEVEKDIVITENGNTTYTPDEGQSFSKVNIEVNVPIKTEVAKNVVINENGNTTYNPDPGEVFNSVSVDVNVPSKTEVAKDIVITENGNTTYAPDAGEVFNRVNVDVNVSGSSEASKYSYKVPTADDAGLKAIGWDDESVNYFKYNNYVYPAEANNYKVSDANKQIVINSKSDIATYKSNPDFKFCPKFDMSAENTAGKMFAGCSSLTSIPLLNTSNVTDMSYMFDNCASLTTIPQMDTSKVTNMETIFNRCKLLTTIPLLDTSNVTDMSNMFSGCSSLTSIPQLDTSKVVNMNNMFYSCSSLTSIPQLDTSNVTKMSCMFADCSSLTSVPRLDATSLTDTTTMFGYTDFNKFTTFGGFTGLKVNLNLASCAALTKTSLLNVFNEAADVTASPKTLTLGSTNLNKLTDEEKAIATNKGWTLA